MNICIKSKGNDLETIYDKIFTIQLLHYSESIQLLEYCFKKSMLNLEYSKETKYSSFRNHYRSKFVDVELATFLFELPDFQRIIHCNELKKTNGRVIVGLNPEFRLYKYEAGHSFGSHYDQEAKYESLRGGYTLLLYLNGEIHDKSVSKSVQKQFGLDTLLKGGETIFYTVQEKVMKKRTTRDMITITPRAGMMLLHAQGNHCLLHKAALVEQGCKWVLRSDVMYL